MTARGYVVQRSMPDRYVSAWRDDAGVIAVTYATSGNVGRWTAKSARHAIDFADFFMAGAPYVDARDEADSQVAMRARAGWSE